MVTSPEIKYRTRLINSHFYFTVGIFAVILFILLKHVDDHSRPLSSYSGTSPMRPKFQINFVVVTTFNATLNSNYYEVAERIQSSLSDRFVVDITLSTSYNTPWSRYYRYNQNITYLLEEDVLTYLDIFDNDDFFVTALSGVCTTFWNIHVIDMESHPPPLFIVKLADELDDSLVDAENVITGVLDKSRPVSLFAIHARDVTKMSQLLFNAISKHIRHLPFTKEECFDPDAMWRVSRRRSRDPLREQQGNFPLEQKLAIFAPYWIPIFVPIIRGLRELY